MEPDNSFGNDRIARLRDPGAGSERSGNFGVTVRAERVYLIDDTASSRSVSFQNHYDISAPVADASAQQLVLGGGRAYRQLLESLTQDLFAFRKTVLAADAR